jgi:hypothetical protein
MNKVIRDGKVAVLVSPGFGAGWSTWNTEHPECVFDPAVVEWVENGKAGPVPKLAELRGWDYMYEGGAGDLIIYWLPEGSRFRIDEYDGSESLVLESEEQWMTA